MFEFFSLTFQNKLFFSLSTPIDPLHIHPSDAIHFLSVIMFILGSVSRTNIISLILTSVHMKSDIQIHPVLS